MYKRQAPERIHTHAELCSADHLHVDHVAEIGDVGAKEVAPVGRRGFARLVERNTLHAGQAGLENFIRLVFDPTGCCLLYTSRCV